MKSPILSLTGQFYTGFPIFLSTHKTKSGMVGLECNHCHLMKILNYLETSPPSLFSFDFFINILVAGSGQVPGWRPGEGGNPEIPCHWSGQHQSQPCDGLLNLASFKIPGLGPLGPLGQDWYHRPEVNQSMSIDARRAGGGMAARPANIYDFYIDVHRFFNNDADTDNTWGFCSQRMPFEEKVQEILASVHSPLAVSSTSVEHPEHVRGVQCRLLQLCIRDLIFTAASNDTFSHSTIQQQSLKQTFANPRLIFYILYILWINSVFINSVS